MIKRRFEDTTARAWPWARKQPAQKSEPEPMLEEYQPARPASVTADLLVPLGQALVTGAMGAGALVVLAGELGVKWTAPPVGIWAITALLIACVAWLILLGQTRRLLWRIERLTGLDLDGDGRKGKPATKERIVIVNAARGQQEAAQRDNAQRASEFAQFVARLPDLGTDARTWEKRIGRETYQEFRKTLIRLGWARWNSTKKDGTPNERRGWSLVVPVAEILRKISA